jgi:hypothetical protein
VHYANENLDRQLLSHSSGLGYDGAHPDLARWRMLRGSNPRHRRATDNRADQYALDIRARHRMALRNGPGLGWLASSASEPHFTRGVHATVYLGRRSSKHITFHQELKPLVKRNLGDLKQAWWD